MSEYRSDRGGKAGPEQTAFYQARVAHERRNPIKNLTPLIFRSTSRAREALLSMLTAPAGSPPAWPQVAGLVVVQASRLAQC